MTPDKILARRLAVEIEQEQEQLSRLHGELTDAPDDETTYALRARASILHDFYTGVERIFVRIADELNGGAPSGRNWHRQLLTDMTLDLPEVRPAVVSRTLAENLDEFLRFRHLFRNVYEFVLRADRLRPLEDSLSGVSDQLSSELRSFCTWLIGPAQEH